MIVKSDNVILEIADDFLQALKEVDVDVEDQLKGLQPLVESFNIAKEIQGIPVAISVKLEKRN